MQRDLEVWWIRHGESEWNRLRRWQGHSNPPLSSEGERQAARLASRLVGVEFDRVYCSDLERAMATARLALPHIDSTVDPRLREVHFGEFEGMTYDELTPGQQRNLGAWLREPFGRTVPGGESLTDVARRLEGWFQEAPDRGRVAVFTHGGVIRCGLWTIVGAPVENAWTVQLANASTTCVRYAERVCIEWVNDCAHLWCPRAPEPRSP